MAIYNTRNKRGGRTTSEANKPQMAQSVNVGQFGPSHDSLQDWRSIFTALNEVKKMATDLYDVDVKVTELIGDAEEAVRVATNAAATATEINEDTITNVEDRWQQIAEVQKEVEVAEENAVANAEIAATSASEASEDARQAGVYVLDASVLKREMEDIRDDVTNLTAGLSVVDEAADARAEFNNVTNHLQLYVPKVNVGGTAAITSVNGKLGPTVQLTAEDVHALPNSGDVAIKDKLSFDCGESRRFEINAIMATNSKSTEPQFSISYHYDDIKDNMHGIILDKIGNAAFGGELYVKNTRDAATRKQVYHEGFKPTPQAIGAAVAADTYTKSDTYSRTESYSRTEVNTELAKKVELNKADGGIYARQNASWVDVGSRLGILESDKVDSSEVNIISGDWDGIINKIPKITGSGVLEVGKYIDFHDTKSTNNYDARLECRGDTLYINGVAIGLPPVYITRIYDVTKPFYSGSGGTGKVSWRVVEYNNKYVELMLNNVWLSYLNNWWFDLPVTMGDTNYNMVANVGGGFDFSAEFSWTTRTTTRITGNQSHDSRMDCKISGFRA